MFWYLESLFDLAFFDEVHPRNFFLPKKSKFWVWAYPYTTKLPDWYPESCSVYGKAEKVG